jgi:hypothetical protein
MSSDTESLMRGAMEAEAFAHRLTMLRIESEHRLALYLARSKPAQAAAVAHAPPIVAARPAPPVAQARPASGEGARSQPLAQEPTSDRFLDRK